MKIISAIQTQALDKYTITHEPISSINLMERASKRFAIWLIKRFDLRNKPNKKIFIFAGVGNNGGDGLAVARILQTQGITVMVYSVRFSPKVSEDFKINEDKLLENGTINKIHNKIDIPNIPDNSLVIDAIFGSGLSRPLKGIAAAVVEKINSSKTYVVSIDIPSGLYCDALNEDIVKIKADEVLSFQLPKLAFLMPEHEDYIGNWEIVDIGLHPEGIASTKTNYFYLNKSEIKKMVKPRKRFSHKGTYGHTLVIAGSKGKIGAAQLTLKGVLKSGAGLLTAFVPKCAYQIIQIAVPEAMCLTDKAEEILSEFPNTASYKTVAVGPGIGMEELTQAMLPQLLSNFDKPMVLDADALNILATNPELLKKIPAKSILTPHPKEFERFVGSSKNSIERWEKLQAFCKKWNVITLLKGAYTAICNENGVIYFNSTGNPGMATGGSGDVLTGVIAGLLSSGYSSFDAARLGVYLHGLAGDKAAEVTGETALSAGDIAAYLGKAFKEFEE
ncbi:MAG: NAD(P)H-hydrate dehydratase [Bacteroidota bacterium]